MSQNRPILRIVLPIITVLTLLGAFAVSVRASPYARDCSGGNAAILSPTNGATVFGIVQIEGTASLGADFRYYKIEVAPAGTQAWGDLAGDVRQPVVNGQLGVWDSASVPDGLYTFRLRVVDPTGNYCEALVTNVRVQNSAPPTPTIEITPTPEETEAPPIQNAVPTPIPTVVAPGTTGTPGPTATALRAEPTRTPLPSSGGIAGIEISSVVGAVTDIFSTLARTFVFGAMAMGAILFLVGVVFFVRRVL